VTELPTGTSRLYGLRRTADDRTNVAFANASASTPVTLRVTLNDGSGSGSPVVLPDVTLAAGQWAQVDDVLAGTGITEGWATVAVVSGSGPYFAYAVFNDNGTNDGSFAAYESAEASEARLVPVVVETGTYASELVLCNPSAQARTVELTYVESLSPSAGAGGTATETLVAGEQRLIPSVLEYLRGKVTGTIGASGGSYAGTLTARFASGGSTASGFAGARTGSPAKTVSGRYGLYYAGSGTSGRAQGAAWIYGLRQDTAVRANVAVSASPENGTSVRVHVEVWNGATGQLAGTTETATLAPGAWKQWANLLPTYGVTQGYVRVVNESGAGSFVAYGVVNDGAAPGSATGTDDGSFVPAVPVAASSGSPASLTLSSPAFAGGGELPVEYTCDGAGASPPLAWTGVPAATAELALMMTTLAKDGEKWNWVLYGIPAATTSLERNSTGVGTAGLTSDGPNLAYSPPCSQGPGAKSYTFSLYALSAAPVLPPSAKQVTGAVLTAAIADRTLATSRMDVTATR
jgi:phosphatidylethanolamine-binding protein (PEBP) family uncharacterized protein